MTEKKERKIKGHWLRKKVLRVGTGILLAVLFLEFVVYFGSNLFLASWARKKVNEATKEVYTIDFNRLNISLIRRGVFLDGIVMKPNADLTATDDQTLFDFSLDQLALKGSWYSFSDQIFYLGRMEFDNPNVTLNLASRDQKEDNQAEKNEAGDGTNVAERESPVASLERELRKTLEKSSLKALFIREIEISNADLFFLNFLSDNSLKVEDSKLLVKDVNLTTQEDWQTPFNAAGFEFEMEAGSFLLPDGVHTIQAQRIFISSLDEVIDLERFQIIPNRSAESRTYYELFLEELMLKKVDLNKAFSTSELEIEEIVLNAPQFNIAHTAASRRSTEGASDLNDLIDGVLKSLSVRELSINQGKFVSADAQDSLKNRIELGKLDFKMVKFFLGEGQPNQGEQFFYGEDASMEIQDVNVYLSDGVHLIQGDRVSVNSFTDEILVKEFKIEPRQTFSSANQPKLLLKIQLPELELSQAKLKRLYNEGKFAIAEVKVNSPKVEIIDNEANGGNKDSKEAINELLDGYLSELKIESFDLRDGEISFTNASGVRSDDVNFDRFSLLLEDVLIEPDKVQNTKEFFLANELVLNLDNYRLKLRDNLHEFSAEKVIVDSKNRRVELQNFDISPQDTLKVQELLTTYGKTAILDLKVPYFAAEDIDLRKAFFEEELVVGLITIPSSVGSLDRYTKKTRTTAGGLTSDNDLSDLLTQYFSSISVDSLSFEDGDLSYQNFTGDRPISISEDGLSIALKNFHVERGLDQRPDQTFFSDEIDVTFKDYSFSLAGGNYTVLTNNIRYNSKAERIDIENLQLIPSEALSSKLILSIELPEVVLEGVNIDRFLFDNSLELKKLKVLGSQVGLELNPEISSARSASGSAQQRGTTLPRAIDRIVIDSLAADDSYLKLDYRIAETDVESIETRFDILVKGFDLDSLSASEENISKLFEQLTINLQDFSFTLPDSVHTLKFSNVELNTDTDESVFSDFQIIPSTFKSKTGAPVIEARIPSLGIKNNTLASILGTRVFNLNQVTLTDPDVKVYLEQKSPAERDVKESKSQSDESESEGLIRSMILDNVVIQNGKVQVFNSEKQPLPRLDFKGVDLSLVDLDVELLGGGQEASPDFFLDQDLNLTLRNYDLYGKDSLTRLTIGRVQFGGSGVQLEDIWYRPTVGRYAYFRKLGYQTDAVEARVRSIYLNSLDFKTLAKEGKVNAKSLVIDGMDIDLFRDKRIDRRPGVVKPMPQELLQSLPIHLTLDSLRILDSKVTYQEFVPRGMLVGEINFSGLNASIVPFLTRPDSIPYPIESALLKASAFIEGDGAIAMTADMQFAKPYEMKIEAGLGSFDLTKINRMMERTAFVGVRSGRVKNGKWVFKMNENEAWGKIRFFYEDLKVEFVDTLTTRSGSGSLGLYTFLANTAIKNQNPRGLFKRRVSKSIYHERDKAKFIFGGWWRATFSGLKGAVGLGQAQQPKRREEDEFWLK